MNRLFVLLSIVLLAALTAAQSSAGDKDVLVTTDIASWHHPTKAVFAKYHVKLLKVELHHNRTYPVFFVEFPWDPQTGPNQHLLRRLQLELLDANGKHNYALQDEHDKIRYELIWHRETHTLEEESVELPATRNIR
ncbi:MAG TPA: hypothetical protein VKZ53_10930 [Candidatus Angelobacter sp.]|nr:hypothetical protein [Candidatus Angelobacter sp.]